MASEDKTGINARLKKYLAEYLGHDAASGILKSPQNTRRYKFLELDNGLRCLLISDPVVAPVLNKTLVESSDSEVSDCEATGSQSESTSCIVARD